VAPIIVKSPPASRLPSGRGRRVLTSLLAEGTKVVSSAPVLERRARRLGVNFLVLPGIAWYFEAGKGCRKMLN
jgi:hypothetical protein